MMFKQPCLEYFEESKSFQTRTFIIWSINAILYTLIALSAAEL